MSRPYIPVELQEQVLADAGHLCGYCHSDERLSGIPLSIEHIIARVADGPTARENLWRSYRPCNEQKGGQIAAADPETGEQALPDRIDLDRTVLMTCFIRLAPLSRTCRLRGAAPKNRNLP